MLLPLRRCASNGARDFVGALVARRGTLMQSGYAHTTELIVRESVKCTRRMRCPSTTQLSCVVELGLHLSTPFEPCGVDLVPTAGRTKSTRSGATCR